jgi:hypothetical protein
VVSYSINTAWALRLARENASSLAGLRLIPGIEVAGAGDELWLRGQRAEESTGLLALPAVERYEWQPPDRLRRVDQRIPSQRLPSLEWQPLDSWLRVELPTAALPANDPAPVALRLARAGREHTPDLLLTRWNEFASFALSAARVRLERWHFAATADGRVLVRGTPLPPLPGQRFLLQNGVAVPAGFTWLPAVSAAVLARRLGASAEALVMWNEDGTITRFHPEQFVPVTRSAIRTTGRAQPEAS